MSVEIGDLEELLESIEIARIRALALRDVPGGGAAARAINALADSVEGLAHLAVLDRRHGPRDRRAHDDESKGRRTIGYGHKILPALPPAYHHESKGRRRDD